MISKIAVNVLMASLAIVPLMVVLFMMTGENANPQVTLHFR